MQDYDDDVALDDFDDEVDEVDGAFRLFDLVDLVGIHFFSRPQSTWLASGNGRKRGGRRLSSSSSHSSAFCCELEPESDDEFESELELEVELAFESELEPDLEPELELAFESELEPDLEPELEFELELEPDLEPELEFEFEFELEPDLEPDLESDDELAFELELELEPDLEPELALESESELEFELELESESELDEALGLTVLVTSLDLMVFVASGVAVGVAEPVLMSDGSTIVAPLGSAEGMGPSSVLTSSSPPSRVMVCAMVATEVQCVGFADLVSVTTCVLVAKRVTVVFFFFVTVSVMVLGVTDEYGMRIVPSYGVQVGSARRARRIPLWWFLAQYGCSCS